MTAVDGPGDDQPAAWAAPGSAPATPPSTPTGLPAPPPAGPAGVPVAPGTPDEAPRPSPAADPVPPPAGADPAAPPDPLPVPLRPMTTGDAIDGAFALLHARPKLVIGIAALFVLPWHVLNAFLQRDVLGGNGIGAVINDPASFQSGTSTGTADLGWSLVAAIAASIALSFVTGAYARVLAAWYAGGSITWQQAVLASLRRAWPLVAAWVVVHLAELPGIIGLGFGQYLIGALFLVVAPAIVVEDLGPVAGLRRAWRIGTRRWWPAVLLVFGSGLVANLLAQALNAIPSTLALIVGLDLGWIILAVGGTFATLLTTAGVAGATALYYLDARVRLEGLDLELGIARATAGAR